MAKYGLLLQNQGVWNGTTIIPSTYHTLMTTPSQNLNQSYGYLTWLNGQNSFMVPTSQLIFPGMMAPHASATTYAALGKNGQIISVSPDENLTWIRMGNGNNSLISVSLWDNIWSKLQYVFCSNDVQVQPDQDWMDIQNNGGIPTLRFTEPQLNYTLLDISGRIIPLAIQASTTLSHLENGLYTLHCTAHPEWKTQKIWIQH
jgi:CubicO group peptidase (beta-lactamase class C family)